MRLAHIVLLGVALAAPLFAQEYIDQQSLDGSVYMAAFSQTDLAQSFQSQTASNASGAAVMTQAGVGGGDTITISLWNLLPNQAGAQQLASGSVSGVAPGQWAEVHWSPVGISDNVTYYLVFTSNTNTMGLAGSVNNPYPYGNVYANAGYMPFPSFDYAFKTYAVPEPTALALLGVGLLLRRR